MNNNVETRDIAILKDRELEKQKWLYIIQKGIEQLGIGGIRDNDIIIDTESRKVEITNE